MRYIGIDLHKETAFIVVMDANGRVLSEREVPTDLKQILRFVKRQGRDTQVAVESTSAWYWLVDALQASDIDVRLAHPKKIRLIAESSKKTDRQDAHELADLLRMDRLPEAYIASPDARARREILRHRTRMIRLGTQATNRMKAEIRKYNLKPPSRNLLSKKGYSWLRLQNFPGVTQIVIDDQVQILESVNALVATLEAKIAENAARDPRVALLTSIPGVGIYTALTFLAEIDTIDRFPSEQKLAAYFGLVPRVRASAAVVRHGRISKEGSRWARWLLIQAAWQTSRHPGRFKNRFRRVKRRRGSKIASVAVARDIVTVMFYLLKRQEPYSVEKGVPIRRSA